MVKEFKMEPKWKTDDLDTSTDQSKDDMYLIEEYTSSYNPTESSYVDVSMNAPCNDSFPAPLNPLFDLAALVMV